MLQRLSPSGAGIRLLAPLCQRGEAGQFSHASRQIALAKPAALAPEEIGVRPVPVAAGAAMLAQGVPLKVAQEVLGHATIAITADIYSHLAPTATRDATERVGALLWGVS